MNDVLIAVCVLLFPPALLVGTLVMAGLESRVSLSGVRHGLGLALADHDPDRVEAFVAREYDSFITAYWRRHPAGRARATAPVTGADADRVA